MPQHCSVPRTACLAANGLRRDDILLIQLPNIVELPLLLLACFRPG